MSISIVRLQRYIDHLNVISEHNREIILKFDKKLADDHMSNRHRMEYIKLLGRFSLSIRNKPFEAVEEDDVKAFLSKPTRNKEELSPISYNSYLVRIKAFFKWMNGDEEYPLCVKKIKPMKVKEDLSRYTANDVWSEEDILFLIKNIDHTRDRALVATIYDFGGRCFEALALRIGDVKFEERYAEVIIKGKIGQRAIPLLLSFPYLRDWINNHPFKDNPNAPLWITLKGFPKALNYNGLWSLFRKFRNKFQSQIRKPFNPYLVGRHSRLTFMANIFTDQQLDRFAGWVPGSRQARRYIHLSMKDVKPALFKHYGIAQKEEAKPSPLAPKICPRCKESNAPDVKYCVKCNLALSIEAWEEEKKKQVDINKLAKKIEALEKMFPSLSDEETEH